MSASALTYDLATCRVLWLRDLKRFWREPTRLAGALGQPLIFWLVLGLGMASTFRLEGVSVDYPTYFYPGVIVMVALFAATFGSVSLIEDRHQGFLQSVLAGPGSRVALVLGKCFGTASVALVQVAAFGLLAPFAGFGFEQIAWPLLIATMVGVALGLSALGFAGAWWLDSVAAYHAVLMTVLVPLWVLSGAMFPATDDSVVFRWLMLLNPLAYAVTGVRHALYGGQADARMVVTTSPELAAGVVLVFAFACVAVAVVACRRR